MFQIGGIQGCTKSLKAAVHSRRMPRVLVLKKKKKKRKKKKKEEEEEKEKENENAAPTVNLAGAWN
jgi:hypothetical protein